MEQLRVVVRTGDPVTGAGLTALLRSRLELRLLPESRVAEAQVVVWAVATMTSESMAALRQTAEAAPVRTVLVVDSFDPRDLLTAVECGVVAILSRASTSAERLVAAVLGAARGAAALSADLVGVLVAQVKRIQQEVLKPRGLTVSGLAEREVDMLRLLAEGWDTEEIAEKLSYSERTVKSMVHNVLQRYQLRNRVHAVAQALRAGVI